MIKVKEVWIFFWWWIMYHGDESPVRLWKESKSLKERLKENGLRTKLRRDKSIVYKQ